MTTVINLYGGPSSGKSTQGAGLFYRMKQAGHSVELVNEFAKEVVWEGNVPLLKDQLYVLAHQHRKLVRLAGKVDYVITDSPVLLSIAYRGLYDGPMYSDLIDQLALECYQMYHNINFMLGRPASFESIGRAQDYDQSKRIDQSIVQIFQQHSIEYHQLPVNSDTVDSMLGVIFAM
jgi:thymidylate kinase